MGAPLRQLGGSVSNNIEEEFQDCPRSRRGPALRRDADLLGSPQIHPVPREPVPKFCADFLHTPSGLNQGQNINGYWMEQSRGQIGAGKIDAVPHAQASVEEYRRGRAGGCRGSSQKTRRRFSA